MALQIWRKTISAVMVFTFLTTTLWSPHAAAQMALPAPGTLVMPTASYTPAVVRGMTLDPKNPLQVDFLVDKGQENLADQDLRKASSRLINYFLASLAIPEKDLWVNLSPYEGERMINAGLGKTEMGRDLLSQDYMLKQLTSSLMFPEKDLGREFWKKVYAKAQEKFGSTQMPVDTFHKVWIVPAKAVVYTKGSTAFILQAQLKVMLESDYLAMARQENTVESAVAAAAMQVSSSLDANDISSSIMREILIPEIEKEINNGKTFAALRQIYFSNILATWFKRNLRKTLLGQAYADQAKVGGIDTNDPQVNAGVYDQYLEAFKRGVFNFVAEERDPLTQQAAPRKYFSGGTALTTGNVLEERATVNAAERSMVEHAQVVKAEVAFDPAQGEEDDTQARQEVKEVLENKVGAAQREYLFAPVLYNGYSAQQVLDILNNVHATTVYIHNNNGIKTRRFNLSRRKGALIGSPKENGPQWMADVRTTEGALATITIREFNTLKEILSIQCDKDGFNNQWEYLQPMISSRLKSVITWKGVEGDPSRWISRARNVSLEDIHKDMYRDYDYRYVRKNIPLKPEVVFLQTLIWAKMALAKAQAGGIETRDVLVARDARKIETEIVDAEIAALRYAGLNVVFMGDQPNVVTSYSWAVQSRAWLMTIFNTASHVSQPENVVVRGFKVTQLKSAGGNLMSLSTREIKEESFALMQGVLQGKLKIEDLRAESLGNLTRELMEGESLLFNQAVGLAAASGESLYQMGLNIKKGNARTIVQDILKRYQGSKPLTGLRIVVEGSHTPSGALAVGVFESLGAKVEGLNLNVKEVSGLHNADPSIDSNLGLLKWEMERSRAHFGIAFDLDGDRGKILLPKVNSIGEVEAFHELAPDNLLGVLMPYLLWDWGYAASEKKIGVIRDVLGTYGVNDAAKLHGFEVFQTDAGYPFLKALKEEQERQGYVFPVYGERSGHTWLHVAGEIENPVAVAVLFANILVKEGVGQVANGVFNLYRNLVVPYSQSPRFQPLYHPALLKRLSQENPSQWQYDPLVNPPQAIVALGRDAVVRRLKEEFAEGKVFGEYQVSALNAHQDSVRDGGLYRFADIMFNKNGVFAGRVVVRASSNDPTFVMSYEAPMGERSLTEVVRNRVMTAGLVMKFMVDEDLGIFTRVQMNEFMQHLAGNVQSQFEKANLAVPEEDYDQFINEMMSFDSAQRAEDDTQARQQAQDKWTGKVDAAKRAYLSAPVLYNGYSAQQVLDIVNRAEVINSKDAALYARIGLSGIKDDVTGVAEAEGLRWFVDVHPDDGLTNIKIFESSTGKTVFSIQFRNGHRVILWQDIQKLINTALQAVNQEVGESVLGDAAASTGGIDLADSKDVLAEQGDKLDVPVDPAMLARFQRGDFTGITANIIRFAPVENLPGALGL